jgi:glycosyltransferase involved in cell wall biosynthesis
MVAGCPVIALNKGGTPDQVLNYNNGILCKNYKDYYKSIIYFIEHPEKISIMSANSIKISKTFYTNAVIDKLMFIVNN